MYAVTAHDGDVQYGVNEYVCDAIDDLAHLPRCAMGSTAIVIGTSEVYIKNSQGEWVKL
jgi:hypothetical protein